MKKYSSLIALFTLIVACGNEAAPIVKEVEGVQATEIIEAKRLDALEEEVIIENEDEELEHKDEVVEPKKPKLIIIEDDKEVKTEQEVLYDAPAQVAPPVYTEEFKPNHKPWDEVTSKHVSPTGKVNYKGMKVDLKKIVSYLEHLKNTPPKKDWTKNEKLAYWINLYNASTVYLIVSNYPVSSINKINRGKPFDKKFIKSGTNVYSLNDIENAIIRSKFNDPRIHAALNCAAVSCPKLMSGAYLADKLNAQLNSQTKAWINDATKNKLTPNKIQVSKIFEWYAEDFKAGGGVIKFVSKYSIKKFIIDPKAKITYLEYDWALNE